MTCVEGTTPKSPEADGLGGKPSSRPLSNSWAQDDLEGWLQPSPGPTAALTREELHSPDRKVSQGFQTKLLAFADAWEDCPGVLFTC